MKGLEKEHTVWPEKYRPKELDDYIGNDHIISKAKSWIEQNDVPHLLFYGKAGTGKSSLAKLLADKIECDSMYINASDENGIDVVREDIKHFASSVSMKDLKIIILDEFDFFTPNAMAALRNPIVEFSKTTRFILTCNYPEKIIDAIHSRTQDFHIKPPSMKQAAKLFKKILDEEKVKFSGKDASQIIKKYYPDLRKILNTANKLTIDGELKLNRGDLVENDFGQRVVELLGSEAPDTFKAIRQTVADNEVDSFTDTYRYLYDNLDEYTKKGQKSGVILRLSDAQHKAALVADKEINFMSCIIGILNEIN